MEPFSVVFCIQLFADHVFEVVHIGIYIAGVDACISADCLFLGRIMNTEPYFLPAYLFSDMTFHLSTHQMVDTLQTFVCKCGLCTFNFLEKN